jgi:hypothetical protein
VAAPVRRCQAGDLELGGGLEVLLRVVLEPSAPGDEVDVELRSRATALELPAWARLAGHQVVAGPAEVPGGGGRCLVRLRRGSAVRVLAPPLGPSGRGLERRGGQVRTADWRADLGEAPEAADPAAGLAPLGAVAEAGGPAYAWPLSRRDQVWSEDLPQLVDGAAATQWSASRDVPWDRAGPLPDFLERAVCQVATFLAQNEYAAYYVPARFMGAVNPRYSEVLLWLASHVHDEARHLEVFTKRALANGARGYAFASTERSLHSLLAEADFSASALLLNVLGEGSFVDLLEFVADHAPDAATAAAARLAHRDELRHVHFGVGHVRRVLEREPEAREGLVAAVEARAARLVGLSIDEGVLEALTIVAAGSLQPAQLSEGAAAVRDLMRRLVENRLERLQEAGFDRRTAAHVSDLHTPNLM